MLKLKQKYWLFAWWRHLVPLLNFLDSYLNSMYYLINLISVLWMYEIKTQQKLSLSHVVFNLNWFTLHSFL